MPRLLIAVALFAALLASPGEATGHGTRVVPLAESLKWPGVSSLIAYRGRLWLANAVKFVNHNSADLYSFDPATGRIRFERHLC